MTQRIPPDGPTKIRHMRADIAQLIRDVEDYNSLRPETPINCDVDRKMLEICDQALAAARRNDGDEYSRLVTELGKAWAEMAEWMKNAPDFDENGNWACGCLRYDQGKLQEIKMHSRESLRCDVCGTERPGGAT